MTLKNKMKKITIQILNELYGIKTLTNYCIAQVQKMHCDNIIVTP